MKTPKLNARDNFYWLLFALILLLFSDAIISQFESDYGRFLVNTAMLATFIIAIWSLERENRRWRMFKLLLFVTVAVLMTADLMTDSSLLSMLAMSGFFVFLALSLFLVWRQVLFTGYVDRNKIIGAICIYILLGLLWAFLYLITEEIFPGSFSGLEQDAWRFNLNSFIYYSMVTLTTLGYGDITPEQPLARFLAYSESIAGIFYTTILVASLIGVRLAHIDEKPETSVPTDGSG